MVNIFSIFGRSPFGALRTHMDRVAECVEKLKQIFKALVDGDSDQVEELAREISKLEHQADLTKNDIRNHLPKGLFLPIDKGSLLEILTIQDSIADRAEDIGVLLTYRPIRVLDSFKEEVLSFVNKNIEAFHAVRLVMDELDELLESSFGGVEAEKVRELVHDVAYMEHQIDLQQRELLRVLFAEADNLRHWEFTLWLHVLQEVGALSDTSEKLAQRVRMTLDIK
jgi:predicted phosphate transport protein (TIGR00153 family)